MNQFQENLYSDFLNNIILRNVDHSPSDTSLRKVPVTFVMATIDTIDLEKLLNDVNAAYQEMSISFYAYDTLIVDSIQYYNLETSQKGVAFRKEYYDFRSLNVYIVDSFGNSEGFAPHFGQSQNYGFGNWITLSTLYGLPEDHGSFTFIHELGHHFGLKHTHSGTEENEDCIIEGENVELVNGFECDKRGDKLCDTPADPNLAPDRLVNAENCSFNNAKCINEASMFCDCADANGDPYKPDTGNYMSYTREICGDHFSPMQKYFMIFTYDDIELDKYNDCEGDFMGDNWSCAGCMEQTACNFDAEALIENYICEFPIEGHNADDVIDNGSCALDIKSEDLHNNYMFSTYPNPFNPIITISFSISTLDMGTFTVYDIMGKHLETFTNTSLKLGNHILNWNASKYPSGVYLIRMDSGEFTKTKKVVLVK